ncbi:MAG: hypothetical protein WCI18_05735 [Pseudomonadota bacterium]
MSGGVRKFSRFGFVKSFRFFGKNKNYSSNNPTENEFYHPCPTKLMKWLMAWKLAPEFGLEIERWSFSDQM